MNEDVKDFFSNSEELDYLVLRPLSHINLSWELTWDDEADEYLREEGTYAGVLNNLILEIANTPPPDKYHDYEDLVIEESIGKAGGKVEKVGNRWVGIHYESALEQGGFNDADEKNLVQAVAGRIKDAIKHDKLHFDDMEKGHKKMLGALLTIILYHRMNDIDQ